MYIGVYTKEATRVPGRLPYRRTDRVSCVTNPGNGDASRVLYVVRLTVLFIHSWDQKP